MNKNIRREIIGALLLIIFIFLVGTIGFYYLLDSLSLLDSFYLTVITLTTVGYGDFSPHTNMPADGNPYFVKLFTIILILFSMGALFNAISIVTGHIVSGEMRRENRKRKMQKLISKQRNHIVVCGGGETGRPIIDELEKTKRGYVLIDKSEEKIRNLQSKYRKLLFVQGDATEDKSLRMAGLDHSAGIVSVLPDEKDNLLIVISANQIRKEENKKFRIVAKVTNFERISPKLKSAGADSVISPSYISGRRMVSEMFRPAVTTFLDRMLRDNRAVMRVEEVTVSKHSPLNGSTFSEGKIRQKSGLVIVAMKKKNQKNFIYNPGAEQTINEGDVLITMGNMERITKLRQLAKGAIL